MTNPIDDATDMLDGHGVRVGIRVEQLPERRLRLTGEAFAAEPDPDPEPDRGIDTPKKFMNHVKTLDAGGRMDAWLSTNHLPLRESAR